MTDKEEQKQLIKDSLIAGNTGKEAESKHFSCGCDRKKCSKKCSIFWTVILILGVMAGISVAFISTGIWGLSDNVGYGVINDFNYVNHTNQPTSQPTNIDMMSPTIMPTFDNITQQKSVPTISPTADLSFGPTLMPTLNLNSTPTINLTINFTSMPTIDPTDYYSTIESTDVQTVEPAFNLTNATTLDPSKSTMSNQTITPTGVTTIDEKDL